MNLVFTLPKGLPIASVSSGRDYRTKYIRWHFRRLPVDITARAGFWSSLYASVPDDTAGGLASVYGLDRHKATLRPVAKSK